MQAELERFDALLSKSASATATLEEWMRARSGAETGCITAHVRSVIPPDVSPAQLRRLDVDAPARIAYRRVWLAHGCNILSVAENWFVPDRLAPAMRARLAEDTTPFGRVIESLAPVRETLNTRRLWSPSRENGKLPGALLHHYALVRLPGGAPVCEVSEVYTRNIVIRPAA